VLYRAFRQWLEVRAFVQHSLGAPDSLSLSKTGLDHIPPHLKGFFVFLLEVFRSFNKKSNKPLFDFEPKWMIHFSQDIIIYLVMG